MDKKTYFIRNEEGKISKTLILIFFIINGIVLYNAIFHLPWIGYDASGHIQNIATLSKFRLPTPRDTYMFYMPPLSYFIPALITTFSNIHFFFILKIAQFLNFIYSIALTIYLLKICDIIRPGKTFFKIMTLSFLGMIPVYYKTFAFIRGEPLVTLLTVFALYMSIIIFVKNNYTKGNILRLGITLGLMALSRQTGLFTYPALIIFITILAIKKIQSPKLLIKTTAIVFIIAFIVGGWHYIHLYKNYGTIASYNVKPKEGFTLSNQPNLFYYELKLNNLFTMPTRPFLRNRLLPTFYSEFWGDYLLYFLIYGKHIKKGTIISGISLAKATRTEGYSRWVITNKYIMRKYLGRVNALSLFPSAIMLGGLILGVIYLGKGIFASNNYNEKNMVFSLVELIIIVSLFAFFYFLVMYPSPYKGDNIKATYMLHIFPLVAILAGELTYKINKASPFWCKVTVTLLFIIFLHNLTACFTRYVPALLR